MVGIVDNEELFDAFEFETENSEFGMEDFEDSEEEEVYDDFWGSE